MTRLARGAPIVKPTSAGIPKDAGTHTRRDLAVAIAKAEACRLCAGVLPHVPRPVLRVKPGTRVLIVSQAPGTRVHASGLPFDDASGDLPPLKICAPTWHPVIRPLLPELQLTLLVGQYAQAHYLRDRRKHSLTETVRAWRDYAPEFLPLPHPSWRNTGWLKANAWFAADVLPVLRERVRALLGGRG